MKKLLALFSALILTLTLCASLAESTETEIGSINVNGNYTLTCAVPEGYSLNVTGAEESSVRGSMVTEDPSRPSMVFSIVFDETYSDVERMNDMTEEDIAFLESTYTEENPYAVVSYMETAYGTKLMCVRATLKESDFLSILTVYKGYLIEFDLFPGEESNGLLTDEQVSTAVDFLSGLNFVPAE